MFVYLYLRANGCPDAEEMREGTGNWITNLAEIVVTSPFHLIDRAQ